MATSMKSTSISEAQVPVSCYFCKKLDIKWKCDECRVRMCSSCKVNIHQGLLSTQYHEVVPIQDIHQSPPVSREVTSVVVSSVLNSYKTTLPAVHTLLCSDDDLLYFNYCSGQSEEDQFIRGKLMKSSIEILQTFQRQIFDIAINKDGDIFLIEYRDHKILILSHSGEVKCVLNASPMILLGIYVNNYNEVIVGIREQGPPFPVHNVSVRQVIIFGSDYQRKVTFEFDKKGNKLFSYAARIRTDSRNDVYVIDHFDSTCNGRIVAVDRNDRLKFTYVGQKDLGAFKPHGIAITPSDNIVVADLNKHALHIINSNGDILGLQFLFKALGINDPLSLCFNTEGYLLIGCWKGNIWDYGKIYIVKLADSLM